MEVQTKNGKLRIAGERNQLLNPFIILEGLGVTDGKVVADLGCGGVGYFVFPAAKLVGEQGKVYAVDILKPNLDTVRVRARQLHLDNVKTVWSNLEKHNATNIPENSIDVAMIINVIFQTNNARDVLQEVARLIKPRTGILAVIDWKSHEMPFGPHILDKTNTEKVKHFAKLAGLVEVGEFEAGKYHFGVKFSKRN